MDVCAELTAWFGSQLPKSSSPACWPLNVTGLAHSFDVFYAERQTASLRWGHASCNLSAELANRQGIESFVGLPPCQVVLRPYMADIGGFGLLLPVMAPWRSSSRLPLRACSGGGSRKGPRPSGWKADPMMPARVLLLTACYLHRVLGRSLLASSPLVSSLPAFAKHLRRTPGRGLEFVSLDSD